MNDKIQNTYYKFEYFRAELYKLLEDIAKDYAVIENNPNLLEETLLLKTTVSYENEIIKIHIDDYLPRIPKISNFIKNQWIKSIASAINSLTNIKKHERTMVYIVVSAPSKNWDIDNRHVNLVINAIKYARIVKDDNISHLAYGLESVEKDKYFTEIYIFDDELVHEKIPYIRKKMCK